LALKDLDNMDQSLLFSVFILLGAAGLLVPFSKLTGLGPVIGYLTAGVLIGPSVFGFIGEPDTILHFSEFGVVMMLFLIGLELKPHELWAMRGKLIGLGGLQVGLTLAIITFGASLLGYPLPTALVIGMALALSSTAVALQIIQDRRIMTTSTGQSAFSILLFQDVIVIAMIAVIPLLAISNGIESHVISNDSHGSKINGPQGIWRAVAIIAVFTGMIIAGRILIKPMFRLIARSRVREMFTAFALFLVIGASLLMGWLGLSAALGAFIGGVVLADSDYRHQLERDIEPFKALLLGLFFISVGMSLDFQVIKAKPDLIIGGVLAMMIIKFMVLYGVASLFKLALPTRWLTSILLCQAGEFGFVLFQFARTEGLMDAGLVSQYSAIIAISMALTPLTLILHDKFIAPRLSSPKLKSEAPINQNHKVLILGFGRVGQVVGRLLHTQDIETTIIDNDGEHIELVKQFGHRVFYGDASDIDLLRMAGAADAEVIIIAIDDVDKSTEAARSIKEHFPQIKLVSRARNRSHVFDLMTIGVDYVERETVRGSLALGRNTLEMLGVSEAESKRLASDFLIYDYELLKDTWEHRHDIDTMIEKSISGNELIKQTLNADKSRND
jgi:monovalent cation:proton antiporter-2 (CPA2) family protein